jgi:hypothetical protein
LRAGRAADLDHDDLVLALGVVWANGDIALVRQALAELGPVLVAANPSLSAFRDAVSNPSPPEGERVGVRGLG